MNDYHKRYERICVPREGWMLIIIIIIIIIINNNKYVIFLYLQFVKPLGWLVGVGCRFGEVSVVQFFFEFIFYVYIEKRLRYNTQHPPTNLPTLTHEYNVNLLKTVYIFSNCCQLPTVALGSGAFLSGVSQRRLRSGARHTVYLWVL